MEVVLGARGDRREIEFEPDTILPGQLDDRLFGATRLQPEKRLQLAVLQDATLTFHRLVGVQGRRPRRLFAEIDAWFASDDADGPFTFVTICDTLNFDPDYIRRGLSRWRRPADPAAPRRLRFRRDTTGTRHQVVPFRRSA